MYKEFIRKYLLENGYGVYVKILEVYREQLLFLETPSRFRRWLAMELDIPIEKINVRSLNSAIQQQKKKSASILKSGNAVSNNGNSNSLQTDGFKFTKPSSGDAKPRRIEEM